VCVLGLSLVAPVAAQEASYSPQGGCPPGDTLLEPTGEWHCFSWEAPGTVPVTPVFLTGPYRIDVTDCSCPGDEFEIRVDGVAIGTTSPATNVDCLAEGIGDDADLCFADPAFSKGTFLLGPGTHQLEIVVTDNPNNAGVGAVRAFAQPAQAIPTLGFAGWLALVVLLGAISVWRLRRRAT